MLEKNITIKGIFTAILFVTLGFTGVSLEIKNVDLTAGTLDIYMTNTAGCNYCTDATYPDKNGCLLYGSVNNNGVLDATWEFSTDIDEATCELEATNGDYFNGDVGGFQFQILGATVTGASGGSASNVDFTITTSEEDPITAGAPNILAFSFTGAVISASSNSLLTKITFTDFNNIDICFGEDTGTNGFNVIADASADYISVDWGGCYCGSASQNDADGDSICNDDDDCPETPAGATDVDETTGCTPDQLSISKVGTTLPGEFSISQNFPNPFNPVTSITFDVAVMDEVSLIVYDLTGKKVATLVSGSYTPGTYNVEWNAVNNAGDGIVSGMYIYRYISSERAITRKMLYLK